MNKRNNPEYTKLILYYKSYYFNYELYYFMSSKSFSA